jgi:hypothetical protein
LLLLGILLALPATVLLQASIGVGKTKSPDELIDSVFGAVVIFPMLGGVVSPFWKSMRTPARAWSCS